eukprot:2178493-Lingulodinium_polyedra.AAC.1
MRLQPPQGDVPQEPSAGRPRELRRSPGAPEGGLVVELVHDIEEQLPRPQQPRRGLQDARLPDRPSQGSGHRRLVPGRGPARLGRAPRERLEQGDEEQHLSLIHI